MAFSRILLSLILINVSVLYKSVAQNTDKVDQFIQQEMETNHIPGLALAIIKEGKLVKSQGYGFSNLETQSLISPQSIVKIASISKPMIAMGILQLAEKGKLNLDDKVSKYLYQTPDTWKEITIRHFLSHTSGLVRESPGFDPFKIQADSIVIQAAYASPIRFTPGEKYEYCNVGYFSLAEIIRKVSGKPWADYLKENIFIPANMPSSKPTNNEELIAGRANAYTYKNGQWLNEIPYLALRPSGAFLSSLSDLISFENALYSKKLLQADTYISMWTPFTLNNGTASSYGLGWAIENINGKKKVRHGGSLNGFKSELCRYIDDQLTVIVLTNLNEAVPSKIADKVAEIYLSGQ